MNAKNARTEGVQQGKSFVNHTLSITKEEYTQHGIVVGRMYTTYQSTLEKFCEGWNQVWDDLPSIDDK